MKKLCAYLFGLVGIIILAAHRHTGDTDALPLIGVAGMIINKETISNIFINLKTTFNKAFDATPAVWQKIAMRVPSTGALNTYAWLSNFPKMKKWIGDKTLKALKAFGYTLTNDDFEATVEVDRNHIEDDQLGIYAPQAEMAGFSAKQFPDEGIMDIVNGVFVNKCYDGQYYCDTDHPVFDPATGKDVSVSNKTTLVLRADTQENAIASFGFARKSIRMFKNDEGQPLNITPNILLCGPSLADTARILANNEKLGDQQPNPYKGTFEVVEDARILSDTAWLLLDTTKPVKPFIYQDRKSPVFVQATDPQSDDVFMRKTFKFGAEARAAFGYGFWQLCFGSTGTGE